MAPTPLQAALGYARRGWRVLALREPVGAACSCPEGPECKAPGKHPRTAHGADDATTDESTIIGWWSERPAANVGVRTGAASGFFALDIDPRSGGDVTLEELEARHAPLPPSVRARTGGGGHHILFRSPAGRKVVSRTGGLGPGLDVKGEGGYIVAPPSIHVSGNAYVWEDEDDSELEDAPAWLLELVCERPGEAATEGLPADEDAPAPLLARARAYLAKIPGAVSGQGGHDQTFGAALALVRGFGLSTRQALGLLEADFNRRCKPEWSAKELRHKVASARKDGKLPLGYLVEPPPERHLSGNRPAPVRQPSDRLPDEATPVLIADAISEPAPAVSWLLEGLLPVTAILLLAAYGGVGKTTLLFQLFACLASGRDFLGFRVPQPVPVLYLFAEGARHVTLERFRVALARLGIEPVGLPLWVTPREFTASIGPELDAWIEKTGTRLVALDTVGLFHDGDENSASDFKAKVVKPLREIMARRDVSFVLVSHENKPNPERKGRHRVRGTSAMVDDSDVAIRLEAPEGDRATPRLLVFEKTRTAALPEPIALEFLPSFAVFERVGEEVLEARQAEREAETETRRLKDLETAVVRYLRREPDGLTKTELTAELHPRRADLVKVLDRLREDSRAFPERDPKGRAMRWRLASDPRQEVSR